MVVKGPLDQQLLKDEPVKTVGPYEHNGTLAFCKSLPRAPFVNEKNGPNENRFNLLDTYDKSSYLSKTKRSKMNLNFHGYPNRDEDLVRKGGDSGIDLGNKVGFLYNSEQKDNTMSRLNKHVTRFDNKVSKFRRNSIYV